MLTVRRKIGERVIIEGIGEVMIAQIKRTTVLIGFDIDKKYKIYRPESKGAGSNQDAINQEKYLLKNKKENKE